MSTKIQKKAYQSWLWQSGGPTPEVRHVQGALTCVLEYLRNYGQEISYSECPPARKNKCAHVPMCLCWPQGFYHVCPKTLLFSWLAMGGCGPAILSIWRVSPRAGIDCY